MLEFLVGLGVLVLFCSIPVILILYIYIELYRKDTK